MTAPTPAPVPAPPASSPVTTHVLDTARGRPAAGVPVTLDLFDGGTWKRIGHGTTDADGRIRDLTDSRVTPGRYRLTFDTAAYFTDARIPSFFPVVEIVFDVREAGEHHHVPLLLSPFGYSTYRGS